MSPNRPIDDSVNSTGNQQKNTLDSSVYAKIRLMLCTCTIIIVTGHIKVLSIPYKNWSSDLTSYYNLLASFFCRYIVEIVLQDNIIYNIII